jgi:hypothetical protein
VYHISESRVSFRCCTDRVYNICATMSEEIDYCEENIYNICATKWDVEDDMWQKLVQGLRLKG